MSLVPGRATAVTVRPAAALLAAAAGSRLPTYVSRDQARAIVNATETTMHRLLLELIGRELIPQLKAA